MRTFATTFATATRYRFKAAHKAGRDLRAMLRAKVDEAAALAKSRPLLQVQRCRSAERAPIPSPAVPAGMAYMIHMYTVHIYVVLCYRVTKIYKFVSS